MQRLIGFFLAALCLALPAIASAADGYVTGNVNMRAGPDYTYPLVITLAPGTPVAVQGCTADWEWCDVIAYDNRGWIAGNFIQYDYEGQPVLLPSYGARIGIPIVTFVISSYWDSYYRNRPFYRQRATWYRRPVPHRPPPRPIHNRPRAIHAAPPRPAPRPTMNRARPGGSPQYMQSGRPPQHAQPGKRPANRRPATRPPPHSSGAPKGKPAPKKKKDHQH
ncbi:MAG TPA: SH3 domain-containing protein [Rhodanobacteraceae bacterium]|nr:SH3 domain-containing protein [Rhodanobacteraceae bacterium]